MSREDPTPRVESLKWEEVVDLVRSRWEGKSGGLPGLNVFGVPRGGIHIAQILAANECCVIVDDPEGADFIVDDLIDSGATEQLWQSRYPAAQFWAPIDKRDGEGKEGSKWIVFPWESHDEDKDEEVIAGRLLQTLGVDIDSDGLRETPGRLLRSLRELTDGYGANPAEILSTRFSAEYDEMVMVRDIEFWSLCEHHVLPFHGKVTVAYIPNGKVVGLSKLARLIRAFSRRLQIQERFTAQITGAIVEHMGTEDAACIVSATHLCMAMRGVETPADMVTSSLRGRFREPEVRAEFLALARAR